MYYQHLPDWAFYDRALADTREALGTPAFEPAGVEGRAMTPEQAAQYALAEERLM